jgi:LPS-assembly protein
MLRKKTLSCLTAILLAYGLIAHADSDITATSADALVINGDKLELHIDRKMRAIGNASISRGGKNVLGDVIDYDMQNDELHVMGNVEVNLDNVQLSGPELRLQLSTSIGEFKRASIKIIDATPATLTNDEMSTQSTVASYSSQKTQQLLSTARGDAETILFEGHDVKRLKDARYTTCPAGIDDWYIKAKELELNNYTESGSATNAYIEIKGIPVLYTPWMNFSYNNHRKSGLLAPTYGTTSNSGIEVSIPYYWNISPNMDATITSRALGKRGIQLQTEFRYLEESFTGVDNLEYLPSDNQNGKNRYYANLTHQHNIGHGWSAGYSLEKVSDNQYFADLSTLITNTSRVNLPQQFNVDYVDETWRLNVLAQQFQTLDGASYPYQRLPQMTLNGNKSYGNLNANLYSELVVFDRNNNATLAVTGTRATVYPSVSLPMNQSYGYMIPKLGIHYTSYQLDNDPNNNNAYNRTLPIASLDSGLFFDREFNIANRAYTQTIEPRLFYLYIPNSNQANMPVFDTGQSDLNFSTLFSENQFNGNDRINNANQLSLTLTARLIETDTGTQRLSATIGQRYYFNDQKVALDYNNTSSFRSRKSSDILAGLNTNLKTHWNVDAFWQYNTDDSNFVSSTISSRYTPEPGKALNLSYSYRRDSIEQVDLSAQWPLGKGWYGIARANYSMLDKRIIETLAGLEYDAGCWQTRTVAQRINTATSDTVYALFFQIELGGIASIGMNPMEIIERSIPGYMQTRLIPSTYKQQYYE